MMSGDYIIVHTRSHDMSADLYTKSFMTKTLYHRLKVLANVYTREELADCIFNPTPVGPSGQEILFDYSIKG